MWQDVANSSNIWPCLGPNRPMVNRGQVLPKVGPKLRPHRPLGRLRADCPPPPPGATVQHRSENFGIFRVTDSLLSPIIRLSKAAVEWAEVEAQGCVIRLCNSSVTPSPGVGGGQRLSGYDLCSTPAWRRRHIFDAPSALSKRINWGNTCAKAFNHTTSKDFVGALFPRPTRINGRSLRAQFPAMRS